MISFTIPGQPQGKGRARTVRLKNGKPHTFTPDKTVEYEEKIAKECYQAMGLDTPMYTGEVAMSITAIFGVPKSESKKRTRQMLLGLYKPTKKPDADNIAKAVCDALNGVAYRDDTQVVSLHVVKIYGEKPGVEVRIWDANGW